MNFNNKIDEIYELAEDSKGMLMQKRPFIKDVLSDYKGKAAVVVECVSCKKIYNIECDEEKFASWYNGNGNIQNVFPFMSKDDREMLISGTCPKCWDEMVAWAEEQEIRSNTDG